MSSVIHIQGCATESIFQLSFKNLLHLFILCACVLLHMWAHGWRLEDNFLALALFFHHAGPGGDTQVISLVGSVLTGWRAMLASPKDLSYYTHLSAEAPGGRNTLRLLPCVFESCLSHWWCPSCLSSVAQFGRNSRFLGLDETAPQRSQSGRPSFTCQRAPVFQHVMTWAESSTAGQSQPLFNFFSLLGSSVINTSFNFSSFYFYFLFWKMYKLYCAVQIPFPLGWFFS